ncbi:MAG: tRNA lysidine(34) synthetase TilS [Rhodoluna sp.]|nr:tRNA lysidine(34) synthetase TilS [Rhodoluna sp.]
MPKRPRLTPAIADVRRAVREAWMRQGVVSGDLVLVACSGGADSLALAAAAIFEGGRAGVGVGAVIVEHGLQAETKAVAEATAKTLTELGASPVVVRAVKVKGAKSGGPEAAARTARYAALNAAAIEFGAKFVMLAHTLNDQAETVLLGLARGSGNRSLNGMAEVNGLYLRPLLGIERAATVAFCEDSGLTAWQDPQNSDAKFARVRARHNVLPVLEAELGPGIAQALARTAEQLREDETALAELADVFFAQFASTKSTSIEVALEAFKSAPLAVRHRVVAKALQILQAPAFARVHIRAIDELVDDWHGQKPLTLPGVRVERTARNIVLKTAKTLKPGAC